MTFAKDLIAGFSLSQSLADTTPANLQEAVCIHQALSLALQALPGLQLDTELYTDMRTQQDLVYRIVESRKHELAPYRLSIAEKRLADSIADILVDEPFVITTGELLHGFDACIVIRLRPGLNLTTKDGVEWSPVLNIEVAGPSDSTPKHEQYSRLRAQYLFQETGVIVQTIPYTSIAGQSRAALRDSLRRSTDLFNAIYPPTVEDAANFNAILLSSGVVKGDGILSSLSADVNRYPLEGHQGDSVGSSFFSLNNGDGVAGNGIDDFDPIHADDNVPDFSDFPEFPRAGVVPVQPLPARPLRAAFGMMIGWIGDLPVVTISPHSTPRTSPTMNYSSNGNANYNRRASPGTTKPTLKTLPQPPMPGHPARSVYPPFVQIGLPQHGPLPVPAVMPAPLQNPRSGRSGDARQAYRSGRSADLADGMYGDGQRQEEGEQSGEIEENTEVDGEIAFLEAQLEIKVSLLFYLLSLIYT